MEEKKLLVLGLDGLSPDFLKHLVDSGLTPNLGEMVEEGSLSRLRSTSPPNSIPAWICMATGKNPGKVGVFDFLYKDGYSLRLMSSKMVKAEPIWSLLSRAGLRVGVVNVPGTYPPGGVKGFMVSGLMTPSSRECVYPKVLGRFLADELRYYALDVVEWVYFDEAQLVLDAIRVVKRRLMLTKKLVRLVEPDFLFLVFTTPDRLFHPLWSLMDPSSEPPGSKKARKIVELLNRYWLELDSTIGALVEFFRPSLTLVVSDHGFGPKKGTFFANECLLRNGFLSVRPGLKTHALISFCHLLVHTYYLLGQAGLFQGLYSVANEAFGLRKLWDYLLKYFEMASLKHVDWGRTYAFSCAHTPAFGHAYLNLAGREPEGVIPSSRYEEVRELVIGCLEDVGKEHGLEVRARRREELYSGPYVGLAPDVIIEVDGSSCEFNSNLGLPFVFGSYLTDLKTSGTHRPYGIFVAYGPDLASDSPPKEVSIYDVMPTIMDYYGLEAPEDLDGRAIPGVA
ncbi:hypothetical protein DRO32_00355 [Candidatus Bathyarchaeota archaeon]|nr:MAG: hypothetical protein DRO32_00355 [Candidatus Bathyarchaeota archaeon]